MILKIDSQVMTIILESIDFAVSIFTKIFIKCM